MSLCAITGTLHDRSGTPLAHTNLVVVPRQPVTGDDVTLIPLEETFTSNAVGEVSFSLYPGRYLGEIANGTEIIRFPFTVPSQDTATLADLVRANGTIEPSILSSARSEADIAAASAAIASAQAAVVLTYANISIENEGLWVSGTSYTAGDVVWSPTDFQNYRAKTDHSSSTDPAADTTNWQKITVGTGMDPNDNLSQLSDYAAARSNLNVPGKASDEAITGNWTISNTWTFSGVLNVTGDLQLGGTAVTAVGEAVMTAADAAAGRSAVGAVGLSDAQTLSNKTFGDGTAVVTDAVSWTGAVTLDPANGLIQTVTLTGNVSGITDSLVDGEGVLLAIDDGAGYTITWPTMTWLDGSAPVLATTGLTWVSVWKVDTTLYGVQIR